MFNTNIEQLLVAIDVMRRTLPAVVYNWNIENCIFNKKVKRVLWKDWLWFWFLYINY